jgi:hypothetical protein
MVEEGGLTSGVGPRRPTRPRAGASQHAGRRLIHHKSESSLALRRRQIQERKATSRLTSKTDFGRRATDGHTSCPRPCMDGRLMSTRRDQPPCAQRAQRAGLDAGKCESAEQAKRIRASLLQGGRHPSPSKFAYHSTSGSGGAAHVSRKPRRVALPSRR